MIKDEFHKTRTLTDGEREISIAHIQDIFTFIYKIQEEVHRFTVGKVMSAKRSTMKHSSLEKIDGIGPSKAKKLLDGFGTMAALKNASVEEIKALKGISEADAQNVFEYFRRKEKNEDNYGKSKGGPSQNA